MKISNQQFSISNKSGFTLIEILVVTGIFVLLAGLGLFMTFDALKGASHRSERDTIVGILSKARSRAMANINQSQYGVCLDDVAHTYNIFTCIVGTCPVATEDKIPTKSDAVLTDLPACPSTALVFDQLTGKLVTQLNPPTSEFKVTVSETGRPDEFIYINNEGRINW